MKSYRLLIPLIATVTPALAGQYTVRTLPAGFDAARVSGGAPFMKPIAADFMGNGRLQWYQGGSVITSFPAAGTLTLPAITLPQTPSATVKPLTAAVCDVDRDGDNDIVRINEWNGNAFLYTLQVFLNNGSGTFSTGYRVDWTNSLPYAEGTHYLKIEPGDFNKDGTVDLAILETYGNQRTDTDPDRWDGKLYMRWNDGTAGFASTQNLQSSSLPYDARISSADYDRDGDLDLYCSKHATFGPDEVFGLPPEYDRSLLFTNNGAGAFTVGNNFPGEMPKQFVDLTGDGWADLADPFNKAFNSGAGTIGAQTVIIPGGGVWNFAQHWAFTDHDGDGLPDVVFARGTAELKEISSSGGGNFNMGVDTLVTLPAAPDSLAAADSDGDGDTDFFVSFPNGTFAFVENRRLHKNAGAVLAQSVVLSGVTALKTADFNRDGRDDLLAVTPSLNGLWMAYGEADGTPSAPVSKFSQGQSPHSVAVADFDRDGLTDVAYTLPSTGQVRLARNTGAAFAAWQDSAIATGLTGVSQIVSGEYGTPNGRPDLFTSNASTGQLRALYQSGSSWAGQNILAPLSPAAGSITVGQISSAAGDELTALASNGSALSLRTAHLSGGWNQLGSTFGEAVSGGPQVPKVIWANSNGDSREEAVFITGTGALASWFPGTGLSFSIGAAPSPIRDVAAVDWNADGRTDFLCATASGLYLFHSRSDSPTWLRTELYKPASGGYSAVAVMNLNRDELPDVAAADLITGRIDYIRNSPCNLKADLSALPAAVELPVGKTSNVFTLPISSAGYPARNNSLADPDAAVTKVELYFQNALEGSNGTFTPGTQLERGLVGMNAIQVTNGNTVVATTDFSGLINGFLDVDYKAAGCSVVPVGPGVTVPHTLKFAVQPGALSGETRFFVTVRKINGMELNGSEVSSEDGDSMPEPVTRPILVTLVPNYTPLQAWRVEHFGAPDSTGSGANGADYDGDGIPNLAEYLAGTNPASADSAANTQRALSVLASGVQSPVNLRLIVKTAVLADPKIKVTIQWTANPGAWMTYTTHTGGGNWTGGGTGGATPQVMFVENGATAIHTFNTGMTPAGTKRQFFRLKVEELP